MPSPALCGGAASLGPRHKARNERLPVLRSLTKESSGWIASCQNHDARQSWAAAGQERGARGGVGRAKSTHPGKMRHGNKQTNNKQTCGLPNGWSRPAIWGKRWREKASMIGWQHAGCDGARHAHPLWHRRCCRPRLGALATHDPPIDPPSVRSSHRPVLRPSCHPRGR